MRFKKLLVGIGVAGAITVAATPAFAHECFIANRSAQGDAAVVAHSQAWAPLTPDFIFTEFFGLSGSELTCALDAWNSDPSLPTMIPVGIKVAQGTGGVLIENNPNLAAKAVDGKGVDHAEDRFGGIAAGIAGSCTAPAP